MRTSRTRLSLIGAALALSVVAAGCSDSNGTATTTTPSTAAAANGSGAAGPSGPACSAVPKDGAGSFAGMAQDPAATAASHNPLLSTLVTAVTKAGLGDTLNGPGPFTIFAPVNDAFAKIPAATLASVLADKATLTKILTLHVVAGKKMSGAELAAAGKVKTVEGDELTLAKDGDSFTVNGAKVLCMDVPVANATVHIIDTVLMPSATQAAPAALEPSGPACASVPKDGAGSFAGMAQDPAATAASHNPLLSTLVTAVTKAGLGDTLNSAGPFTIFAPVNDAFAKIPAATLNSVLADKAALTKILTLHVVAGKKLSSADLATAGTVDTVQGGKLTIAKAADGSLTVNGAKVLCMDVPVANATVHIIDTVLMPG